MKVRQDHSQIGNRARERGRPNSAFPKLEATPLGVWPVLMRPDEIWRVDQAAHYAQRDPKTIRRWCKEFGIGRQAGSNAPLEISRVALEMVLQGDSAALELLREGKRTHAAVQRYFDHIGLRA